MFVNVKKITSLGLSLTLAVMPAATIGVVSAQPVLAQKGVTGNSNAGRGNRGNSDQGARGTANRGNTDQGTRGTANRGNANAGLRGNSSNAADNGQGTTTRELRGANAANANPVAQARAAINSRPGQTAAYQQAVANARSLSYAAAETGNTLAALQGMTKEAFEAANPGYNYEETLAAYDSAYRTQLESAAIAQQQADRSLATITGGRQLSPQALSQLNAMLGL